MVYPTGEAHACPRLRWESRGFIGPHLLVPHRRRLLLFLVPFLSPAAPRLRMRFVFSGIQEDTDILFDRNYPPPLISLDLDLKNPFQVRRCAQLSSNITTALLPLPTSCLLCYVFPNHHPTSPQTCFR